MKNKHMSLEDRCKIEKCLNNNLSFKSIANEIGKNCTTISREIKNHYTILNKGAYGRRFNDCLNRGTCPFRHKCKLNECINYEKETCPLLNKPPYVCNGCDKKKICTLSKRIYEDFEKYMKKHPDTPIVEMDSVYGVKGGKVLLTIHFVNCSFMLAFIREHNDAQSVIDVFNYLQSILGIDKFKELFVVILTDNGSEFSNPIEIEFDSVTGEKRTQIFYCHPSHPEEKVHVM